MSFKKKEKINTALCLQALRLVTSFSFYLREARWHIGMSSASGSEGPRFKPQ